MPPKRKRAASDKTPRGLTGGSEDFVDMCGLEGAPSDASVRRASGVGRQYPGRVEVDGAWSSEADEQRAFILENLVLEGQFDKVPRLKGDPVCWELFRAELGRLITVDERPFANAPRSAENWLVRSMRSRNPVQAAHVYWAFARGCRFLPRGTRRRPTKAANNFPEEHRELARKEVQRQHKKGFVRERRPGQEVCDVHPLLSVNKGPGVVRIVCNASKGDGNYETSVNGDIGDFHVELPRFFASVKRLRKRDFCVKMDVGDFFLCIPLAEDQFKFAMLELDGVIYFYAFLPLGIRNSMRLAQAVSNMIVELMELAHQELGMFEGQGRGAEAYCDDFFAAAQSKGAAGWYLATWLNLMNELRLPYDLKKKGKIVFPRRQLEYLGIWICTDTMTCSLSVEKQDKLVTMITEFLRRARTNKKEIEQVHGRLNWAACVLPAVQILLLHLRRLMACGAGYGVDIWINVHVQADLNLIRRIMMVFNGQPIVGSINRRTLPFDLETDASLWGGGAWFGGHSRIFKWLRIYEPKDMAIVEAMALRRALEEWGSCLAESLLHVWVDNQGLYHLLAGGSVHRCTDLQRELVRIVLICVEWGIQLVPHWFEGEKNQYADAASRVHQPGREMEYQSKLDGLSAAWRAGNEPWRWSRRAAAVAPAAAQLLKSWQVELADQ